MPDCVTHCVTGNAVGNADCVPLNDPDGLDLSVPVAPQGKPRPSRRLPQAAVWAVDDSGRVTGPRVEVSPERAAQLRRMPYREYLRTPEWDARRVGKIVSVGRRCQVCNSARDLEVHHRTYERRGAERWGDLTVLCAECHRLFSTHGRLVEAPEQGPVLPIEAPMIEPPTALPTALPVTRSHRRRNATGNARRNAAATLERSN